MRADEAPKHTLQQEWVGTATPHLEAGCVVSQLSLVGSQLLHMPCLLFSHLRSAEAQCGARGQDGGSAMGSCLLRLYS